MTVGPESDTAHVTGQTEDHLCSLAEAQRLGAHVHRDMVAPFLQLRGDADRAGFDLRIQHISRLIPNPQINGANDPGCDFRRAMIASG